uniref:Reverse transcriptase domain-containing protein n=1 Tax=Tanacetum cinerariifolium TaxID=118510 RepID=A0A699TJJ3_TANCI|nr:reverse transcriptase domain-containing protein [Tanacetum cinerariifolium]GFD09368.1 reverse transcriptase domain-containing protein [Tanacetum cinerariifolium]
MNVIIEMEMEVQTVIEMKKEMEILIVKTTMGMETMVIMREELCKLPGNNVAAYTQRFQELYLLCPNMVLEEEDKIERFIWGLPDSIQGNLTSFSSTRFHDGIRMESSLMDQKVRVNATRESDNKRK